MRLFYALNFNQTLKDEIYGIIQSLEGQALKGNFTRRENLHLTLAFLGETAKERLPLAVEAMENISSPGFALQMKGLGSFKRPGGDIYWLGIAASPGLLNLQRELKIKLLKAGFPLEKGDFKPHLTLGREVIFPPAFNLEKLTESLAGTLGNNKKLEAYFNGFSLMQSQRIAGKLVYGEIYFKSLGK